MCVSRGNNISLRSLGVPEWVYGFMKMIFNACKNGNLEIVKKYLSNPQSSNVPLRIYFEQACLSGQIDIVRYMIDFGVDPTLGIHQACCRGNMELITLLLDRGADPNVGIYGASSYGYLDIIRLLVSRGANPNYGIHGAIEEFQEDAERLLRELGATA